MRRNDPLLLLAPALLMLAAAGIATSAAVIGHRAATAPDRLEALVAEAAGDDRPLARLAVEVLTLEGHAAAARALGLELLRVHPEAPEEGRRWLERAAGQGDTRAAQALRHSLQEERQVLTDALAGGRRRR